ncbi:MAG: bifunctional proline dehydrogenase/L-glutamate gamma-semialdehyde dehydrogenase PutA [Alphaproteobacteria bacterium]|nr:bifunctional proline dehydrogenase/L-glutamate gamma-semialdehyde dehydrogenase PutA [Alphaproteobacteria bacterium]
MVDTGTDDTLRQAVRQALRGDETASVEALMSQVPFEQGDRDAIGARAKVLVEGMRVARRRFGSLDDFLQEYELTTPEGVALMCLAEALLRVPDAETADRLIADKLGGAEWEAHLGNSESWFVNASTWALMLSGRVVQENFSDDTAGLPTIGQLIARVGEPVIRQAVRRSMRMMGGQFVIGRTIGEALKRAAADEADGYRHSFDMLGEAARTAADAERYFQSYMTAIEAIGEAADGRGVYDAPGISVKLSALFPRYEFSHAGVAVPALVKRLLSLSQACRHHDIGLTVDAEEADRLDTSLDIIAAVYESPTLDGWSGFGLAVQAYQKRAVHVVDWLVALAERVGRPLNIRLVKGAYWDSEIKWAQEEGLSGYPVFTRKSSTDVSYLACAARLVERRDVIYPMFATHNAHSVAAVLHLAGDRQGFEFQRLHGMGEPLYHQMVGADASSRVACRIYAPVGSHEDLLPYLVRRLLENGANTSFVNRLGDDDAPLDDIIADPVVTTKKLSAVPHQRIPLPADLFAPNRQNSSGIDLTDPLSVGPLLAEMATAAETEWRAGPLIDGDAVSGETQALFDPADNRRIVGRVNEASPEHVDRAFEAATEAFDNWSRWPADERAACLERAADLMEADRAELMALAVREAGKTIGDALGEVREAVDFCRYYALRARADFARPNRLDGPTGETNDVSLHGRGVFVCISPWNFPLAIFIGQVTAALAAGNAVIAKPAEQTPLIAFRAVSLLHEAGVPAGALNLLPGSGTVVGQALVADPRNAGVAFTGSTDTARAINRALAARDGPIVPFIAETGGQNAMIVDATALPEQVTDDAITSGFRSAGQRCSALRVMFVQDDVAGRTLEMLRGASAELTLGDPMDLSTDVGPIIDRAALATLTAHAEKMAVTGKTLVDLPLPSACEHGSFFGPKAFEIDTLERLDREVFGPVIHVIRYQARQLDAVIEAVNRTGYGLTLGIHSRIESTQRYIAERVRAGNAYVNRSMIGAVVGVQPFGGEGLSGTGPKAGGPHYLHRFAVERTLSVNTTAAGGNTTLVTLED